MPIYDQENDEFGKPLAEGNIQLTYRIAVLLSNAETILYADGAEVFQDEHGNQWIKFFAKNGPQAGKEHMMRTDEIIIVRQ